MRRRRPWAAGLLLALTLSAAGRAEAARSAPAAPAAGAGRVRIQAGPVWLEGPASYRGTLEELAARARAFLPSVTADLGVQPAGPMLMVLIPPDTRSDPELARLDRAAPPWAAGFALEDQRIGAIRLAEAGRYPFGDPGAVLVHEVTHVLIHDAARGEHVPRWFHEGVATSEERRWTLRDAYVYSSSLLMESLPTLEELNRAFATSESGIPLAYAASFDFIRWARDEYGDGVARRVLAELGRRAGTPGNLHFREAWRAATGDSLAESEEAWRRGSLALYRWLPALTGAGTLWIAITALFLYAAWRRRLRTRELMDRWEDEDSAAARWRLRRTPYRPVPPEPEPEEGEEDDEDEPWFLDELEEEDEDDDGRDDDDWVN